MKAKLGVKRETQKRWTLQQNLREDLRAAEASGRSAATDVLRSVASEINRYRAALMPDVDIESARTCSRTDCLGLCLRQRKEFTKSGAKYVRATDTCVDCGDINVYSFPAAFPRFPDALAKFKRLAKKAKLAKSAKGSTRKAELIKSMRNRRHWPTVNAKPRSNARQSPARY